MKQPDALCPVYLNNQRYVFDDRRSVFRSSSGLSPKSVTMEQLSAEGMHAGLAPAYVIAGVPYYYDEARDELARVLEPEKRLGPQDYRALLEIGAVTAPKGTDYKHIVDRERARLKEGSRER
jgi:hypothetical protein